MADWWTEKFEDKSREWKQGLKDVVIKEYGLENASELEKEKKFTEVMNELQFERNLLAVRCMPLINYITMKRKETIAN